MAGSQKLTQAQKTALIDFVHIRPEMQIKRFSATYTKQMSDALWGQISAILNTMPGGAVKDANKWNKTYRDLINNMKNKKSKERKHARGTGGGPPLPPETHQDLTTDEKMLDILSPTAIEGYIKIPDPSEIIEDVLSDCNISDTLLDNSIVTDNIEDYEKLETETEINKKEETEKELQQNLKGTGTQKKRFRYTKTGRLPDSIKNNKTFLALSERGMTVTEKYREKKLELLKNHYEKKHVYYEKKQNFFEKATEILQEISNSINILATVANHEFLGGVEF